MRALSIGLLALVLAGCGKDEKTAGGQASTQAATLEHEHECAACGMIVAEQSAPRAQLVHRDGTRQWFCSIGDLLAYIQAPSAHGAVLAIHVETQDPAADPRDFSVELRPWLAAERASYVVGIAKQRVMGEPIMVYERELDARAVAKRYGGEVVGWPALKARGPGQATLPAR